MPIAEHWKSLDIHFDAFYTGYLGSLKQIEYVEKAIAMLKNEKSMVITDPAMADNGKLYNGFVPDFPLAMLDLCQKADVIVPNITEAALMLGIEYQRGPYSEEYIEVLLKGLYAKTHAKIVLTGVFFNEKRLGAAVYDGENTNYISDERIGAMFHGTGDVFASALVSGLVNGKNIISAAEIAVKYTAGCVKRTFENENYRYGVDFESEIPNLIKYLGIGNE